MKISILTLFPKMFEGPFSQSIVKRAVNKNLVSIELTDIRNFGIGRHKIVDDRPFGGGVGMVMRVDVLDNAIRQIKNQKSRLAPESTQGAAKWAKIKNEKRRIVLLDPRGEKFNQEKARKFAKLDHLILVCGHYEGVDERITNFVDEVISIGDYVLTGGELPAMVLTDSVIRLIPGVLEKKEATEFESFSKEMLLEYPQYTKPRIYKNLPVPKVLLLGNHQKIALWRKKNALKYTKKRRPELFRKKQTW